MTNEKTDPDFPEGFEERELEAGQAFFDEGEDDFLTHSLAGLSEVQVPSNLLPTVMFRVYEKHHRAKVDLRFVALVSGLLLLLCLIFFALDVNVYRETHGLAGFGVALEEKVSALGGLSETLITDLSGLLLAIWHIVSGALGLISLGQQALLVVIAILLLYSLKVGLSGLMGK